MALECKNIRTPVWLQNMTGQKKKCHCVHWTCTLSIKFANFKSKKIIIKKLKKNEKSKAKAKENDMHINHKTASLI